MQVQYPLVSSNVSRKTCKTNTQWSVNPCMFCSLTAPVYILQCLHFRLLELESPIYTHTFAKVRTASHIIRNMWGLDSDHANLKSTNLGAKTKKETDWMHIFFLGSPSVRSRGKQSSGCRRSKKGNRRSRDPPPISLLSFGPASIPSLPSPLIHERWFRTDQFPSDVLWLLSLQEQSRAAAAAPLCRRRQRRHFLRFPRDVPDSLTSLPVG